MGGFIGPSDDPPDEPDFEARCPLCRGEGSVDWSFATHIICPRCDGNERVHCSELTPDEYDNALDDARSARDDDDRQRAADADHYATEIRWADGG